MGPSPMLRFVPLVALVAVASPGAIPVPGPSLAAFEIAIPVSAAASPVPVDASAPTPALLSVSGAVVFAEFAPGGAPVTTSFSVKNEAATSVRVTASSTALLGPEGAEIAPSYLVIAGPGSNGLLSNTVEVGSLAPGASVTLSIRLTPPHGDVQYLPAGAYRGTLSLRAEVPQ